MNCGRPLDGGGGGWGRHSAQWMVGWRMEGGLRATLILFSRSSKDNLRDLVATITWWAHTHTQPHQLLFHPPRLKSPYSFSSRLKTKKKRRPDFSYVCNVLHYSMGIYKYVFLLSFIFLFIEISTFFLFSFDLTAAV
jgi:hypothetical protein